MPKGDNAKYCYQKRHEPETAAGIAGEPDDLDILLHGRKAEERKFGSRTARIPPTTNGGKKP
ncbi:MAG: hypothetical protein FJ004_04155 [Chloroflexi bacterium]|nr:hypothetical protein [Chloroflexota bacterium]